MSDFNKGENSGKKGGGTIFDSPLFTFSKPYLDFIGKGKMYNLVYLVMAAINLLLPLGVLVLGIKSGLFSYGGAKYVIAFILSWLVIVFACWIGFQLWWNRKSKVTVVETADFVATPMVSDIVQTLGEWLGTLMGIIGAGVGLIALIFLGNEAGYLFSYLGMDFLSFGGVITIIAGPVAGFFIIILFRFLAEQLRIFAAFANNTKEIANNLKK